VRPYHEQLTAEEFRALSSPLEVERMPHRLYHWGLVQYGVVPDGKFMRAGWEVTEDGAHVRHMAAGRFGLPTQLVDLQRKP